MKSKKTRDANLERMRLPLILLGIAFSSAIMLSAFEWKTYDKVPELPTADGPKTLLPDETVIAVIPEKPKPAPKTNRPVIDQLILVDLLQEGKIDVPFPELDIKSNSEPDIIDIDFKAEEKPKEEFILFPDEWPEFPGGEPALYAFLKNNIDYPQRALDAGVKGTVYVQFIIDKDGSISDITILRGIGAGCDEEAERVISQMPNWKPGKQRGHPVKVRYRLPLKFNIKP